MFPAEVAVKRQGTKIAVIEGRKSREGTLMPGSRPRQRRRRMTKKKTVHLAPDVHQALGYQAVRTGKTRAQILDDVLRPLLIRHDENQQADTPAASPRPGPRSARRKR
jgi:hypothetical protein